MGTWARAAFLTAVLVVLLAACGASSAPQAHGCTATDSLAAVPLDPLLFAELTTRPDATNRIESELRNFAGAPAAKAVVTLVRHTYAELHIDYTRDIAPWVGPKLGILVVRRPARGIEKPADNVALILPTTRPAAAEQALSRVIATLANGPGIPARFDGLTYSYDPSSGLAFGMIGTTAVFGGQVALDAIAQTKLGHSLGSEPSFACAPAPTGTQLLKASIDPHAVGELLLTAVENDGDGVFHTPPGPPVICPDPCTAKAFVHAALKSDDPSIHATERLARGLVSQLKAFRANARITLTINTENGHESTAYTPAKLGTRLTVATRAIATAAFGGRHPVLLTR